MEGRGGEKRRGRERGEERRGVKGKLLKKFSLKIPFKTFQSARRSGRVRAFATPRS